MLPHVSDGLLPLPVDVDVILWSNPDMDRVKPALVRLGRCLSRLQVHPCPFIKRRIWCRSGSRATGSISWRRSMKSSASGGRRLLCERWALRRHSQPPGGEARPAPPRQFPSGSRTYPISARPPKRRAQWRSLGCDGPRGVVAFTVSSYHYAPNGAIIILRRCQNLALLPNDDGIRDTL